MEDFGAECGKIKERFFSQQFSNLLKAYGRAFNRKYNWSILLF